MTKANDIINFFGGFLLVCVVLLTSPLRANEESTLSAVQPLWRYSAELDLVFLDKFRNPVSAYPKQVIGQQHSNRTLGLNKVELGLELLLPRQSRMRVGLRPDALNSKEPISDNDARAGDTYTPRAQLQFLDRYELAFLYADNLSFAAGVYKDMATRQITYPVLLEFGLEVSLPQRFSAFTLNWNQSVEGSDRAKAKDQGVYSEIYVYQGNDDRAELKKRSDSTNDVAPEAKDAHLGVAALVGHRFADINYAGLLVGTDKSDYELKPTDQEPPDPSAFGRGKRTNIYAQLFNILNIPAGNVPVKMGVDLRLLEEKWTSDAFRLSKRSHQSLNFSTGTQPIESLMLFTGVYFGKSKFAENLTVDGYQLDLGAIYAPNQLLSIRLSFAEEHRERRIGSGARQGAFVNGQTRFAVMRRFALGLNYQFNKS